MKIAQIAPPWIEIPPKGYGGIEWIVSLLADGLVARGHDVTVFASGGSVTTAKLDSVFDPAPGPTTIGDTYLEVLHCSHAYDRAAEFDVIHDHDTFVGLALGRNAPRPVVHTIHGPLYERPLRWYRMVHEQVHLVAISDSQHAPAPDLRVAGRVYNGIPIDLYPYREQKDDFLLFVGRVNEEKAPDLAVEIAKRAGLPLTMVAAIKEKREAAYWEEKVEPVLTGDETILGQVTLEEKADLMARARALLFPIQWPEPFGLVMAEANACGTPVIGCPRGAAPEVVEHGVTGFLSDDLDELVAAVKRLGEIDPAACRARVERLFSADAMVDGYEQVYEQVLRA